MSAFSGRTAIRTQPDGASTAAWGPYELRSAFQPVFAFTNGRLAVTAFEGLLRPSRNGEPVPPASFFGTVETAERMNVETLTRNLHLINAAHLLDRRASVFVNFDPSVFVDQGQTDRELGDMHRLLHEIGLSADRVVCEVTEQETPSESALVAFVRALRRAGHRIAVDDYGSADSDMRRIEALRPDIVKFDARWITDLMRTGPGFALLADMVKALHARKCLTVFEGIEEGWQLELAERSGVNMVQGYALARPELAPAAFHQFPIVTMLTVVTGNAR